MVNFQSSGKYARSPISGVPSHPARSACNKFLRYRCQIAHYKKLLNLVNAREVIASSTYQPREDKIQAVAIHRLKKLLTLIFDYLAFKSFALWSAKRHNLYRL